MALSDWTTVPGSDGAVLAGPTLEVETKEAEAGDFAYGFNSHEEVGPGVHALVYTKPAITFQPNKGSAIHLLMKKISPEGLGVSPFLFVNMGDGVGLGDTDTSGYILGLQNDGSNRIVLAKGPIANGCPAGSPGTTVSGTKIIARGSASFPAGSWVHLRLAAIVQTGGDVVLRPSYNVVSLASPAVWLPIPGMEDRYVDGVTQQLNAGAPLTEGRCGFGFAFTSSTKGAAIDYVAGGVQN